MIIGINGLIGSGKGAASEYLQKKYSFKHVSFADSLKEAISVIFGWDFNLLLGHTPESRIWREQVDEWWSKRLNIPNLSPRWILQQWGTEVGRYGFHPDIWVASLERKLSNATENIVIDDCRFTNEMSAIRNQNGKLIRIIRGELPEWYDDAIRALSIPDYTIMEINHPEIHISEWGWINENFDYTLENNGTLQELYNQIDELMLKVHAK